MQLTHIQPTLARALVITRREVRDQFRDWRIIAPVVTLTLFFPLLMNFTAEQALDFVGQYGAEVIGTRLVPFLLMVVGFFPISVSLVIALESFVGEKERHSIEPLLATPMSDLELYVGKLLASTIPPLLSSYLGIGVYLLGLALSIQWFAEPLLLFQIVTLTTLQALVMVAGAVVISTQVTSVRAANLLASFIIIPFALLIQAESLIMFWGRFDVLWWMLAALAIILFILVRMGIQLFNREELLGRDLDEINLEAAWRIFAKAFVGAGAGRGVWGWYKVEVWPTVKSLRWPMVMVVACFLVASLIGYSQAANYRLPLEVERVRVVDGFGEQLAQYGFMSPLGAAWVFFTNLRALGIAAALGAFSWGVLAIVLLMIPMGLVGFFAGQMSLLGISPAVFLFAYILPHGILEIPAAVLSAAAILRLGTSIIAPPPGKTLGDGWLMALADLAKLAVGLIIPMLFLAAILEAFLTPQVVMWVFSR